MRRKYPYCRDGYPLHGFDPIVRNYVTLMYFTAHDTAVIGKVLCKPTEQKRTALLPDKNSHFYSGYEKRAKEKEEAIEDLVPAMGYYQMQVQLEEVIYDDLQWKYTEKEILDVYINSHAMYVLPEIEEGRFIFFLDGRHSEGKRAWEWSNPKDCFYVSGWNRVYSYKNVEALNQYSGKSVQYLSEEICRLKEERKNTKNS